MSKLKNFLLELEESGIIEWSDIFQFYVLTDGDPTVEFNLNEYLRKNKNEQ